jgi:two-component system LytT family response regulator
MIRCIIVDDEPLARERLGMLLREAGGDLEIVAEARDGAEAIALASELRPDLLFLDVQMPGLDGFDVVDLLPSPRPMVVFVTA